MRVDLILGNDLAGGKISAHPCVTHALCHDESGDTTIYPACAVTRAMARAKKDNASGSILETTTSQNNPYEVGSDVCEVSHNCDTDPLINLSDTFMNHNTSADQLGDEDHIHTSEPSGRSHKDFVSRRELIILQEKDPSLSGICDQVVGKSEAEAAAVCYYVENGVLMRKWQPLHSGRNEGWRVVNQVVVPEQCHQEVLHLAHEAPMAGHYGINKTYQKILQNFYWPGLKTDMKSFYQSCHACQLVGKPNQNNLKAPLRPIPASSEPFSQVIIDCVGPLPKTKAGHQ